MHRTVLGDFNQIKTSDKSKVVPNNALSNANGNKIYSYLGGISWHLDRPYAYHAIQENGGQLKGLVICDSTIME